MATTHSKQPTFGAWLQQVAHASANPMAAASGMGEAIDSDGGFLIPPDFSDSLALRVYNTGQILSRVTRLPPPAGNRVFVPTVNETSRAAGSRFGAMQVFWESEGQTITASRPKFGLLQLRLSKLTGVVYTTDELLQDAAQLQSVFERVASLELSHELERTIVAGTGAGQPLGLLNSGAKIAVARAGSGAIVAADVRNMATRLWGACWPRAVWLVNESAIASLLALADSNLLSYGPSGLLLCGRPVLVSEVCAALGSESDIVLTDLGEYLLVDKVNSVLSIHVRFVQGEGAFRVVWRVAGQLLWDSALAPMTGGDALSCLVTLAA